MPAVPLAGAVGVLATVVVGLLAHRVVAFPPGAALQLLAVGDLDLRLGPGPRLAPWAHLVAYAVGAPLVVAAVVALVRRAVDHARHHRPEVLALGPRVTSVPLLVAGVVGVVPFAGALLGWGLVGVGTTGPVGASTVVERVDLLVTGALALAALVAPYLAHRTGTVASWLLVWVGCATVAVQGPLHALAAGGPPRPVLVVLAAVTAPAAVAYGLGLLAGPMRRAVPARP